MPYKKRRIVKSPNKNQERSQRSHASLPSLQSVFPEIDKLVLVLQFSNKQGHILQDDHREYAPGDPVNFVAPCPGGCGDGQTNLQGKIDSLVRQRQTVGEGQARCAQPLYDASELCGCEIHCKVNVVYRS